MKPKKRKVCKHKFIIWTGGEFSTCNCVLCGKRLKTVYTPNFDAEVDRAFIMVAKKSR